MINQLSISAKEIVTIFANATLNNDIEKITELLSNNGEFQIQNIGSDDIATNKEEFLKWYKLKLLSNKIESISYDNCLHCSMGQPVILFNNGLFPKVPEHSWERSKTGLMIKVENNMIIEIKFCHVFAIADNDYVIDCRRKKANEFMEKGFTETESMSMAREIDLKDII